VKVAELPADLVNPTLSGARTLSANRDGRPNGHSKQCGPTCGLLACSRFQGNIVRLGCAKFFASFWVMEMIKECLGGEA